MWSHFSRTDNTVIIPYLFIVCDLKDRQYFSILPILKCFLLCYIISRLSILSFRYRWSNYGCMVQCLFIGGYNLSTIFHSMITCMVFICGVCMVDIWCNHRSTIYVYRVTIIHHTYIIVVSFIYHISTIQSPHIYQRTTIHLPYDHHTFPI